MAGTFISEGREEHVQVLMERYVRVRDGDLDQPHLVSLEGRPGYGKTRIIQELYARIAADQDYWPRELVADAARGVQHARKVVGFGERAGRPDFVVPAGARPGFVWLGVQCEWTQTNYRYSTLSDATRELRAHFPEVFEHREDVAVLREAGIAAAEDALGFAVDLPAGIPVASTLIQNARASFRAAERLLRRWRAARHARTVDADIRLVAESLAAFVAVAGRARPFVLAVEDAHDADPALLAFLGGLLDAQLPVLVVAASHTDVLGRQATDDGEASLAGLLTELESFRPERITRLDPLEPLPDGALEGVVRRAAPRTATPVVAALVNRAEGNPYVLQLLLELRHDAIRDDAYAYAPAEIGALPVQLRDLLERKWEQLPQLLQDTLARAAVQGREFAGALLDGAGGDRLDAAADPYEWVRRVGTGVYRFHERDNHAIALDWLTKGPGGAAEARRLRKSLVDRIVALTVDAREWYAWPRSLQRALLRVHLAIAEEAPDEVDLEAAANACFTFARTLGVHEYRDALAWCERGLAYERRLAAGGWEPPEWGRGDYMLSSLATFFGWPDSALAVARDHLARTAAEAPANRAAVRQAQLRLARCLAYARRDRDALEASAELLESAQGREERRVAMEVRREALVSFGGREEARRLESELADMARDSPPSRPEKTARENEREQIDELREAGDVDAAIACQRRLLETAATGAERWEEMRRLAGFLADADRTADAVDAWRAFAATAEHPDHQSVIQDEIARLHQRAGQLEDAIEALREAGRTAEDPLLAREAAQDVPGLLDEAGRREEAIEERRTLLESATAFGERERLVEQLADDVPEEAVALWRALRASAFGADERRKADQGLMKALHHASRYDEAADVARELLRHPMPDLERGFARAILQEGLMREGRHGELLPALFEPQPDDMSVALLADAARELAERGDSRSATELLDEAMRWDLPPEQVRMLREALGRRR